MPRALRITLGSGWSLAGTGAVFIIFAIVYAMVLPATYTGGVVGLVSLRFLTPGTLVLALVMALLLALTIALAVHGFRNGAGAKSAGGALGAILGILPSLLCCSPILPLGIAAIAAFLPAAGSLGAPIQGFIATHEFWIYGVAIVLMVWGLYGNARRILSCTYRCSSAPTRTQREVNHACCEPSANRASGQEPRRSE
ncbi:MAG TPA: hypothetical protein VKV22_05160 [Rhodanobacteraceae bacterium]|nr:hypothetical protein [Rhodanobacteraceae bacterium]